MQEEVLVEVVQVLSDLHRTGAVLSQVEAKQHVDLCGQREDSR
jgi:hypothetical protein